MEVAVEYQFQFNKNTEIVTEITTKAIGYAIQMLKRDMDAVFMNTDEHGGRIYLVQEMMEEESYNLIIHEDEIILKAQDELGFIYGIIHLSNRYLGIQPFWFWNDQEFEKVKEVYIKCNEYISKKNYVKYRGWFINDEVLIHTWDANQTKEAPWEMAFEALLRCGGNMVIPGTDKNSKIYAKVASGMGLWITHHHAEPLGAEMFARAFPDKNPSYAEYPELFQTLWLDAIHSQKDEKVIWNLGFRGQGDCPFWESDKRYDSDEARGALISKLIRLQYDLLHEELENPVCCTNLYGEVMELYQKGYLQLPEDVIYIWADNGYGKMVTRRQGNHNPRIRALPEEDTSHGLHGAYYHASFYDLQAANHITMQPNSLEFITKELKEVFKYGKEYLIVNCSNVKPHVFQLEAIAKLWRSGDLGVDDFKINYVSKYFSMSKDEKLTLDIANLFTDYAKATIAFGEHEDEHAGEQFTNYITRDFITQWIRGGFISSVKGLHWATGNIEFSEQVGWYKEKCEEGYQSFHELYERCFKVSEALQGRQKQLFQDSIFLQIQIMHSCMQGAVAFCKAYEGFLAENYIQSFYYSGSSRECYENAVNAMCLAEHDKWEGFYKNECLTDIKFTAYLLGTLMRYIRIIGDGPHFYKWQREYLYKEEDKRVVLLTNMENHLTDDEFYQLIKLSVPFE